MVSASSPPVQRRRIFVNANRLAELSTATAPACASWDVDLNPFKPKAGEVLVGHDIIDQRVGDETRQRRRPARRRRWSPGVVARRQGAPRARSALRRRPSYRLVDVDEVPELFHTSAPRSPPKSPACATCTRATWPALSASMPLAQRKQLAEAMDDDRLADLLEELPEAEQLRIIEGLDLERLVDVLEEMEYDDLADLLAEMPGEQRTRILDAMDAEDADQVRRLLTYEEGTAGALMTPDIIILGPTATVAEALAELREPGLAGVDRRPGVRRPAAVQDADGQLRRCRALPATPPRAAAAWSSGDASRRSRRSLPICPTRGRRAVGELQHACRRVCATSRSVARRDHRRRRLGPHVADRMAPAQAGEHRAVP